MHPLPANTVARKVNRETIVLLGWGRAILLQLAHPLVAAAVGDYSNFGKGAGGYLRRARRTVGAMLALSFGESAQARAIIARINAIHRQVNGTLPAAAGVFPAGTIYSARDPALLCWVNATLIESLILTYEQFVGPLTMSEKDQYTAEAGWLARELGVPGEQVPATYAEVRTYLAARYASGEIAVTDTARRLAAALLAPPLGPAAAPLFRVTRLVTVGMLPGPVREAYGFPWSETRARAYHALVRLLRRARWMLPAIVREWPAARAAA